MDTTTKWMLGLLGAAALGGAGYLAWRKFHQEPGGAAPLLGGPGKPMGESVPGKTQPVRTAQVGRPVDELVHSGFAAGAPLPLASMEKAGQGMGLWRGIDEA